MIKSRSVLFVGIAALLGGCNSTSTTMSAGSPPTPKKPSYVRFINLTKDSFDISLDGVRMAVALGPNELTGGSIISIKDHKITTSTSTDAVGNFKPDSGFFTTIVFEKVDGKLKATAIKGGPAAAPETGSAVEYINLTKSPVSFKADGDSKSVAPNSSETIPTPAGSQTVEVQGAGKVDFSTNEKEIWGVYVISQNGKNIAASTKVKGPVKPSLGGASPMG